jgi:hypothetical protein
MQSRQSLISIFIDFTENPVSTGFLFLNGTSSFSGNPVKGDFASRTPFLQTFCRRIQVKLLLYFINDMIPAPAFRKACFSAIVN